MPMVIGKCPNCGGILHIDNNTDTCICQYCSTPIINEKAINNYNITNNVKADNVQIYGAKDSIDAMLKKEEAYIAYHDKDRLCKLYEEMIDSFPARYEGWWEKMKLQTDFFQAKPRTVFVVEDDLFRMCLKYAPESIKPTLKRIYYTYKKNCITLFNNIKAEEERMLQKQKEIIHAQQKTYKKESLLQSLFITSGVLTIFMFLFSYYKDSTSGYVLGSVLFVVSIVLAVLS